MSQFGAEKFTTRSRAAIESAQLAATTAGNTATEPIHLLVALLSDADGTAGTLVTKAGVDPRVLTAQAEAAQAALPRASGTTVQQPGASSALTRVLARALELAESMQDDYVASEHLLIAVAAVESPAQKLLARAGLTEVRAPRGPDRGPWQPAGHLTGRRVDVRGAGEVQRRPHPPAAEDGRLDPVIGRDAEIRRVVQVLSPGVPRTTRCSSASPVSARPPSSRGWRSAWSPGDVPDSLKGRRVLSLGPGRDGRRREVPR